MRTIAAGLAIFTSILAQSSFAHACDCERPSLERAREQSDVILEGRVQTLSENGATFHITQHWKGVGDVEELEIGTGPGTCAFGFALGEIYLIFARQEGAQLRTNICDRSALITAAEADLAELGPGVVPVDPGSDPEPEPEDPPAEDCAVLSPGASEGSPALVFAFGLCLLMRRRRCP